MKPDRQPDIVETILMECWAKSNLSEQQICEIELKARHHFGGEEVYVAKTMTLLTPEVIQGRINNGEHPEKVANHYGITRRTIYNIFRRGRKDEMDQALNKPIDTR